MKIGPDIAARGVVRGRALLAGLLLGMLLVSARLAEAAELIMFEQPGCPFCLKFDAEIAPTYPDSAAGRLAPLRRVNIHDDRRGGIPDLDPAVFTPTFVLVGDDGQEVGRLQGYPGRRWFYPELDALIAQLPGAAPARSFEMKSPADSPSAGD